MSYYSKYQPDILEQELIAAQSESSGAFCRTYDIYQQVNKKIEELNEQDAEGHIWWNRFKELLEQFEPSLKKNILDDADDLKDLPF